MPPAKPPPARAPLACGALGGFDRDRVLRMGAALGTEPVHEDDDSILLLDREPVAWQAGEARGLGWIDADVWQPGPVSGWEEAARRGLTGFVATGRRRFLHSAVNGVAPLYWMEDGDATYFASRIDPLVRAAPGPLSIDWEAWAAIIALRNPLGERTPFAEVSRLGPFRTLRRRRGRSRVKTPTWAWTEVDPGAGLERAADGVAEALRASLSQLPDGIVCPLSGGRDSRMLCCALAAEGRVARVVTGSDDEGEALEERLAAPVAEVLGVPQEQLPGYPERYPADWEERARRVEYQFVDHAWLVPVAQRLEGLGTPVPDGFVIDTLIQSGNHFSPPEVFEARRGRTRNLALFDALRIYGKAQLALDENLREPIVARARDQFLAVTRPLVGHPSQNPLSIYVTRSLRGISQYPTGLLGTGSPVIAPAAGDQVVSALLSATQEEKRDSRLYSAVFERLAPQADGLPSTADTPRAGPRLPRRWLSTEALDAYRASLAEGPLAGHLAPQLRTWLADPASGELSGDLRLGMEAVSLLHAWWRRYRDVLREVDVADLAA
ncbi:MAG TPA: hypothetical protein VFX45_08935 [Solirubrobacterales bacterium]|nr:hypothetical protein [Solirubrobacterales bacterium]